MGITWQREDVTTHYLQKVRRGIPFGANQANLMLEVVKHFVKQPKLIMDLGCGNGFLAEILLRTYPAANAICIDHSAPMIEQAKVHMATFRNLCEIILADFRKQITNYAEPNSVDIIVSGYAIHHLPHEMKKHYTKKFIIY